MTKLCGYLKTGAQAATVAAGLERLLAAMRHGVPAEASSATFAHGGVALLQPQAHARARLGWLPDRTACLALAGFVTPDSLPPCDAPASADLPTALLHAWRRYGAELLPRLDGDFVLAHYDLTNATLTLASSYFGALPLYYIETPGSLAFASEAKALARFLGQGELDWDGVADFCYVGHLLGNATLFAGVRALGAGEVLTYANGRLHARRYVDFTHTPVMAPAEVSTARLAELFHAAVASRQPAAGPTTLLMSGGMDSRLILGALRRQGATPRLVALEHGNERGGTDGRYATEIARRLGMDCELRHTHAHFYASPACLEVFYILDGMAPSWELFISQVYAELEPGMGVVWEGMGLGSALGCAHQRAGGAARNMDELLEKWVVNRGLLRRILAPEAFARLDAPFMERLQAEIERIPASENQYLYFLLQHRIRRRIAPNPYQLFAGKVEPRTPGTDRRFLEYVLGIPVGLKLNHRLYVELYKQQFPELTAVPIITGGAPLAFDAGLSGWVRQVSGDARMALRRVSRRYNLKRRLKQTFSKRQTGEERAFAATIKQILGQATFDRPFYNTAELRRLFADYCGGAVQYQDLFAIVFYIELWHRLFLQPDAELRSTLPGEGAERLLDQRAVGTSVPQAPGRHAERVAV